MDQDPLEALGDRLRQLRRSRMISQRHLAELAGVRQSTVCRFERRGEPRWELWQRLFSAVGYYAVLLPMEYGEDDLEDLIQHGLYERKVRMEDGRSARWR